MSTANRVRLSLIREVTLGTTPATPRMRTMRITKEQLAFTPTYIDSKELRSDRMQLDPIKTMQGAKGPIDFEFSYPLDNSPLSEIIRSAMFSAWTNTPTFDNDITADSVVTDAGTTTDTYVVASGGASVVLGHLVRATGFTNSANNQVFRAASSSSTTIVGSGLSLTAETAPPAAAKLKVVGFEGASGDVTATSTGLGSTSLDFTTLGLAVGQWVKIGGTASSDKFATAACKGFARISVIAANALTLDNRPTGWTTDSGTSKTIKVWFGDQIKNGTATSSVSIEKGFLDQTVPTYIITTGMVVDQLALNFQDGAVITGTATFLGMGGSQGTSSVDSSPDATTTGRVMAGNADVSRVSEAGSQLTGPNFVKDLTINLANNLRTIDSIDQTSPVGINSGTFKVTGKVTTYFGDNTLLAKLYSGTTTSISSITQKDGQAVIVQLPRVTLSSGDPDATGIDTDVMLDSNFSASIDTTTNSEALIDRMEYFES